MLRWLKTMRRKHVAPESQMLGPALPKDLVDSNSLGDLRVALLSSLERDQVYWRVGGGSIRTDGNNPIPLEARVEGYHSFDCLAVVQTPEEWAGYLAQVFLNNLGSQSRFDYLVDGLLGEGWVQDLRVTVRIFVNPEIGRELVSRITSKDAGVERPGPQIGLLLRNVRSATRSNRPSIAFDVTDLSVCSWDHFGEDLVQALPEHRGGSAFGGFTEPRN